MNELINLGNGQYVKVMMLKGESGSNIVTITKESTSGLVDTYRVTLTDGSHTTFQVTNGNGIVSIERTATVGLVDTYTITFQNGQTTTFNVTNSNVQSVNQNIAPTESSATSLNDYDIGAGLINSEGKYCVATDQIHAGDTLTIGKNIEYSDVDEQIGNRICKDTVLAKTPTYEGSVLLDKMYGMSIQNGTPTPSVPVAINSAKANFQNGGKNLINLDLSILQALNTLGTWSGRTYTRNNISFTVNTDGTVSVMTTNDGASGGASLILISNHSVSGYIIGKNYTIKGCPSGGSGSTYSLALNYRRGSSDYVHSVEDYGSGANKTFENVFDVFYPYIWVGSGTVITTPKVFEPMLCLSDFADKTFNIFKGKQTVTTDLVLRAIEVTSSDDYNLVKDGHYYVADTLDKVDRGYQITRRTSYITFNGTESWDMSGTIGSTDNPRRYSLPPQYWAQNVLTSGDARKGSLSDKFAFIVQNNVEWGNFNIAPNGYFLFYDKNGYFNSKSEFLAWLSSNAPSFLVPITTPTVETVSNADAKKLLSLKSYDEATYVAQTENIESIIELMYGCTELSTKAITSYIEMEKCLGINDNDVTDLIRFGMDENGNYGYYKVGADSVTPFKNPIGNKAITINSVGTTSNIDVEDYKTASVTTDGLMVTPSATKNITSNGNNQDVLNYDKVNVNVPQYNRDMYLIVPTSQTSYSQVVAVVNVNSTTNSATVVAIGNVNGTTSAEIATWFGSILSLSYEGSVAIVIHFNVACKFNGQTVAAGTERGFAPWAVAIVEAL